MGNFSVRKSAIIISALTSLGFVFADQVSHFDSFFDNILSFWRTTAGTNFFQYVSMLGSTYFLVLASVLFCFYLWRTVPSPKYQIQVFLIFFALNVATGQFLKWFVGRDRPLSAELFQETTYSFPSGHSLASVFFYLFVACIIYRFSNISLKWKKWISIVLIVLVLAIGFSRLYLGVHFFSDVVAGFLFGWFWLNFSLFFLRDIQREKKLNVVKVSG